MYKLLPVVLLLAALPATSRAQSYETLKAANPGAYETTVRSASAFVYSEPVVGARVVGRYAQGREVLAYNKQSDFYAVATKASGHVGYMLLTDLDVPQEAGAAVAPDRPHLYKDPRTARTTSFALPGGGHIYAGETTKGAAILLASAASFITGYALTENSKEFVCDEEIFFDCATETDYSYLVGGSVVALGFWAIGVLDAPRAARRSNVKNGFAAAAPVSLRPVALRLPGRTHVGLAMKVRF